MLRYVGHWQWLGFGCWLVEDQRTGTLAGEVGFADYKRDMQPSLRSVPELGWIIAPAFHNCGYATEAVRAVQEWGDTNLGTARTVCIIHPDNAPSLRVAAKCNFVEYERGTYRGQPTILFERLMDPQFPSEL